MDPSAPLLGGAGSRNLAGWRRCAYFSSCFCCLFSASFTVFSLYTQPFEEILNYSPLELNYVSIGAEMGLYLFVPIMGFMADAYKLSYLGYISCGAYFIGYQGCMWVVESQRTWPWMAFFFGMVGLACSASFISSLVNCARLFPNRALLAISVPTALYGCSSLIFAHTIDKYLSSGLSLTNLYLFLGVFLPTVGIVAALAPRWGQVDVISRESDPEQDAQKSQLVLHFLKDHRMLWLLFTFFLVSGSLEMFQNNIGLLVKSQKDGPSSSVSYLVAVFTSFSTIIRFVIGGINDAFGARPTAILLIVLLLLALTDLAFAEGFTSLFTICSVSGIVYGSSFTLYPLIVSKICGIERFATYWGFFVLGPALGSFVFGVLFATNIEKSSDFAITFRICAAAVLFSCAIISSIRRPDVRG
nr:Mch1.1 [Starmerella bombicola]